MCTVMAAAVGVCCAGWLPSVLCRDGWIRKPGSYKTLHMTWGKLLLLLTTETVVAKQSSEGSTIL